MAQIVRSPRLDLREVLNLVIDTPQELCVVDRRSFVGPENPFFGIEHGSSRQRLFLSFGPEQLEFCGKPWAHVNLALGGNSLGSFDLVVVRDVPADEWDVFFSFHSLESLVTRPGAASLVCSKLN
jgi:hypothetical protein